MATAKRKNRKRAHHTALRLLALLDARTPNSPYRHLLVSNAEATAYRRNNNQ